ncbi:MAG: anaerobic ribonucleoside triphosphate reductase, partial [Ruthenibacterium sp.]
LLTAAQAKAHTEGDIHIHDFDFYALTTTCCQIDLISLFKGGFSTGHGYLREPQSIASYAALAAIAIQSNQNDQHGGQGVPNFDYAMADGVRKTFSKVYARKLQEVLEDHLETDDEKELATRAIAAGEQATGAAVRMGEDIEAFDAAVIKELFESSRIDNATAAHLVSNVRRRALQQTDRETYQAMEGFVHNLNTMHSRAGAQTPFSSINYGTDTTPEGRMAIRNILNATDAGLGHGETAIFPIHIFKVKEGVNYFPDDPNFDLFEQSCRVSAKRLFPNYVFLDSPFNLQYYKAGHPETEVATMGCRTRVMANPANPDSEIAFGRGNLSFTSINLPRIAILAEGNEKKFYKLLDERLELVAQQLLDRFAIQGAKRVYNYPFLMGQGVWLDSDKLGPNDEVREVLTHGSLSIGFIGLAETLMALYGHHHGESAEMQEKGLAIVRHMRQFCDDKAAETHLNFGLLATPAEGLSGRFVRMDRERFGEIKDVTDREYYTNSFHIPVWYPISAYDKINTEAPYHALTNAGHISYVELDGDTTNNVEAFESVVRCMHDAGIGYGSINHPVDRDPVCGYVGVIGEVCPRCGRREGEAIRPEKLAELQKLYPGTTSFCGCE